MNLRTIALATLAGVLALSGCGDPQSVRAQLITVEDVYTLFALSGTPAAYPSGLDPFIRSTVRVDGNGAFDVAFDINAAGEVVIYPVQKVVSALSGGGRRIGLQKATGTFESVTLAPGGTYPDSAVVAAPGEVILIQSTRNGTGDVCAFDISPYIYTKLSVVSVSLETRMIVVQTVMDPNCGFRSFESGIPER